MTELSTVCEIKRLIQIINLSNNLYLKYGARSSKKVDYFHTGIKEIIEKLLPNKDYCVKLEYNVPSINSSNLKRSDIVILKNLKPFVIFPVKLYMTNYKQNKNNSWENLTGEVVHLKWANDNIHIIPINIFWNKTPYLNAQKKITKFEKITKDDIKNYSILKEKGLCYEIINIILDIDHSNNIGDLFCDIPPIVKFDKNTEYISFENILKKIL